MSLRQKLLLLMSLTVAAAVAAVAWTVLVRIRHVFEQARMIPVLRCQDAIEPRNGRRNKFRRWRPQLQTRRGHDRIGAVHVYLGCRDVSRLAVAHGGIERQTNAHVHWDHRAFRYH